MGGLMMGGGLGGHGHGEVGVVKRLVMGRRRTMVKVRRRRVDRVRRRGRWWCRKEVWEWGCGLEGEGKRDSERSV